MLSAFVGGMLINFLIDLIVNLCGVKDFCSIAPDFIKLFPTPVIAAYVNMFLYGVIGATFAVTTVIYEFERIGFVIQSLIYFLITGAVCVAITVLMWQLQRYPKALIFTLAGYFMTHIIMITIEYKTLKKDILKINEELG